MGSADPPGKMDEKLKSENMQKEQFLMFMLYFEWWVAAFAGVVISLEQDANLHMAQLMPLPLTVSCFSKIQIGFTFWYRLTRVVPEKRPLNGCVCVYI